MILDFGSFKHSMLGLLHTYEKLVSRAMTSKLVPSFLDFTDIVFHILSSIFCFVFNIIVLVNLCVVEPNTYPLVKIINYSIVCFDCLKMT